MSRKSIVTSRKKSDVHKHWSAHDKVKAVAAFLVAGNMARVSESTGIPLGTLNYWKTQPWWFEQIERIRKEEDAEIDSHFTRIVKRTQEIMLDRLDNGDFYVTKDGEVARKPVSMRDAAIVGAIGIDKRSLLRQVPQSEQSKMGMQERLKNLEMQFTKLVDREKQTIDITPTEVEDGEELQEGVRSGGQGAEGSEGCEEQSAPGHDEQGLGEGGGWEGRGAQESSVEGGRELPSQPEDGRPRQEQVL